MTDFNTFLKKNKITPENTPNGEYILIKKAFFAGMKSQKEKLDRLVSKNKALKMDLEDCLERVEQMNLLFSTIEEEQEK